MPKTVISLFFVLLTSAYAFDPTVIVREGISRRTLQQTGGASSGPATPSYPYYGGAPSSLTASGHPIPTTASDWHLIVEGLLYEDADTVWTALEDPRVALAFAFRQFAYEVEGSGSVMQVVLNSAQEIVFRLTNTDNANRYHHYSIFGHTSGIFNVASGYVNIRRSELFIMVNEHTDTTSEIVVGLVLSVSPPSAYQKLLPFLHGFLEQLVDHFQLAFGAADCGNAYRRETTGICNNLQVPAYGASETALARLGVNDPLYQDGISTPRYHPVSPRRISNIVCDQGTDMDDAANALRVTDLFVFFGQFIDHDVGITPVGSFSSGEQPLFSFGHAMFKERFDISIPDDDPVFQGPFRKELLPFDRSIFVRFDGMGIAPRTPPNSITAYLDLSQVRPLPSDPPRERGIQVYGADHVRAKALREFSGGRLKTSGGLPGFLPFNGDRPDGVGMSLENAPNAGSEFYVAGDIRAQENSVLAALHALWLREHNLVASELDAAFMQVGIALSDEDLFQYARDICVAEYQSIVYKEWLPLLLGSGVVSPHDYSYDPAVKSSLDVFFTTASFRFGHSMVNNWLSLKDATGGDSRVKLEQIFFKPETVSANNFAYYLFGAACHEARELDEKVVDSLRSKLFTEGDAPSEDLVSLNIQRARDHGLPSYNEARAAFYLTPYTDFSQITNDPAVVAKLRAAYNDDISLVDAFVGGLAESKPAGRLLGDLFFRSVADQFRRLRDGDRLFYKGLPFSDTLKARYPRLNTILQDGVTLADILHRNTDISAAVFATYGDGPRSVFQNA